MSNESAQIVIVGGGVIGLGIAYHLAELGVDDVVLVERHELTSGTSWHAAGIVGPLRSSVHLTKLATYATELFPLLEEQTGQSTGYQQTGGVWLATEPARLLELQRIAAVGDVCGLQATLLEVNAIRDRIPFLHTDDLAGALWVEEDGQANPVDICRAYAKGAKSGGIRILEGVSCTAIATYKGAVHSIDLSNGDTLRCGQLINCAGAWARSVGEMAGVPVPLQAVEHMYVVTEPINTLPDPVPVVRDLDQGVYLKGDAGKLVLGGFETNAKVWDSQGPDGNQPYIQLNEDWQQFEPFMQAGLNRVPALATAGIAHFMNGPESFTPDSRPLMGESPFLSNYYVAAGFNSVGMMSSAGVGKVMAQWLVDSQAPMDLWEFDIARFGQSHNTRHFLAERMCEAVHDVFAMHWPNKQKRHGRDLRRGALHEAFAKQNAVFIAPTDWERPAWFATTDSERHLRYSYSDQSWWSAAARECQAIKNGVALLELSPFTKIDLTGPDALTLLQRLCVSNMDVAIGASIYTQWLNERGGIEADVTVMRAGESHYRIISGAATRFKDFAWLQRHARDATLDAIVSDVTDEFAVLGIVGPLSRTLLQSLIVDDLSNEAFSVGMSRLVDCQIDASNLIRLRITRVSFTGELGFELTISNHAAVDVFSALHAAGDDVGLMLAGHYALDACRLEKAYRHFGHDIGPNITPLEAGLGFTVAWDKSGGFIGDAALHQQREQGVRCRVMQFSIEQGHPLLLHDEPIYAGGQHVGLSTSGGRGFRTQRTLCLATITCDPDMSRQDVFDRSYTIRVADSEYALTPHLKPIYDPQGLRRRS